ncbi:MAG: preprotein translocase subunit SecG [Calditrichaeota bacterium]|jgi:preprotein translocase subunit SecG|nr:preprotein translocase subunit SecG [Calditrichota bacterium]MBT7618729.1 preprotein translocase subunit SecG [Calditrichota bacterium]MBT7787888.1 preprotein translocase subunit SecG [Calditrichota bacterium]
MFILKVILTSIHVIVSVFLVVVILLQSSKGGGLSGTFGGSASTNLFGPRGTADALAKVTQYLAGGFLVLSLTLSMLAGHTSVPQSVTQQILEAVPAANLPNIEELDYNSPVGDAIDDGFEDEAPVAPAEESGTE